MTVIPARYVWLVWLSYPASGLALGLSDPLLGQVARQLGARPGVATAVSVNLLLPCVALALGFAYARLGSVWLGAGAMALGLVTGLAVQYAATVRDWSPAGILSSVPPVLVVAPLGYAILGTIAALAVRAVHVKEG
jgi:hypothetical protein